MYRPPYADGIFNFENRPIGLVSEYRRRPVRGRRAIRPPRQIYRPPRANRPNSANNGHINTTNNNATNQARPHKSASGVTVINKVHTQDSKPQNQRIPSTCSNENTDNDCDKANIHLNITTTITNKVRNNKTSSANPSYVASLDHNGDCPEITKNHKPLLDKANEATYNEHNIASPDVTLPNDRQQPHDVILCHHASEGVMRQQKKTTSASTSSFNEIYKSLENADLSKLLGGSRLESLKEQSTSTESMPPLIKRSDISDNAPISSPEDVPFASQNKRSSTLNDSLPYDVCTERQNRSDFNKENVPLSRSPANSHPRSATGGAIAPSTKKHVLFEKEHSDFPEEETDIPNKPLQIFSNDPAALVASVHGNVFTQCHNEENERVIGSSLYSTSQLPANPSHLLEQLTIIKMHRDIAVDSLEDKKTEVSRLWERLDVMKNASDRLLISNNELCTERDTLKIQLEKRLSEKEKSDKEMETLRQRLTSVRPTDVSTSTATTQTDKVSDDQMAVEKEAFRLRIVQLQKMVSHKDNRIREIADNANRTNQKLRNDIERLRNSLQSCCPTTLVQHIMSGGRGNAKGSICERTDRRDKLIAELPHWNYINPCDLSPIMRLGSNVPVLIGQGVFGKVELMQFLPTRTLVAVKSVYVDANAPEKTRNHIRLKFQCEVRAMQVTSGHYAFPFLMGVVNEGLPLRLVALFLGDHKSLESRTISRVLKSGQPLLTSDQWLDIVVDIVSGLKFLHENKLLHNDLKGDNILVVYSDCRWAGRIIDLGQASSLNHPQEYKLSEEDKVRFRKNHTHIAPELVDGITKESPASDIFQIGLIMREIGLRVKIPRLECLGDRCINKDPYKRPHIEDILAHDAFNVCNRTKNIP